MTHIGHLIRVSTVLPTYPLSGFRSTKGFILETPKCALGQTVETQMKCSISSGSPLFARIKTTFRDKIHHYLEKSASDPLKYTMGSPILIVSIYMEKSTRIQRVKYLDL